MLEFSVENNYFILVSKIIENSINTKSTSVVSTNNYDFHISLSNFLFW